jgi:hypothetical protein
MPAPQRRPLPAEEPPLGAHLTTPRFGYTHHGIYIGAGRVVHYAGLSRSLARGPVEVVTLARFAGGRGIVVDRGAAARFAPEQVVARAVSRLGEDRYRLATNNCEHFCTWCRSGDGRSEQVERLVRPLRSALADAARALRAIAGTPVGASAQTASALAATMP